MSAVCRSPVKAFPGSRKQTGFAEGESGSRWCNLCFMIQREARKHVVWVLSSAHNTVISCHLWQHNRQGCVFETFGHLSSPLPSLRYLSGLSCTAVAFLQACRFFSRAQTFPGTLDVYLSRGKTKKKAQEQEEQKRSVGKAKDWIDGGETR